MSPKNDNTIQQSILFKTLQKIATDKNAQKFMRKIVRQKGDGEKLSKEVELQIQKKLSTLINREVKQLKFLMNSSQRFKTADNASKINTLINFVNYDYFRQTKKYLANLGLVIGGDELADITEYFVKESLKDVDTKEQLEHLKQFRFVIHVVRELDKYGKSKLKKWLKISQENLHTLTMIEMITIHFCTTNLKAQVSSPAKKEIDLLHKTLFNDISSAKKNNQNKSGIIHKLISTSKKVWRFLTSPFKRRKKRKRTPHIVQKSKPSQKSILKKIRKKRLNKVLIQKSKRSGSIRRILTTKFAKFNVKALACFGFLNLLPLHRIHRPELWFIAAAYSFVAVSSMIKPKKILTRFFCKKNKHTPKSTTENELNYTNSPEMKH
ncbi:MAG: hypothetical protein PVI75_05525 [Gammaproteobacteria bacterium]|jgi:hypothetical protein